MATPQEIEYFITTVGSSANQIAKKFMKSHSKAILPSIVIAQSALESGWGTSSLSKSAKNIFGMKVGSGTKNTYYDGSISGAYRKYSTMHNSVGDYYDLMVVRGSGRYEKALNQSDVSYVMNALVEGGYCPDAGYAQQVVDIYNSRKEQLQQYDEGISFSGSASSAPLKDYRSLVLAEARRIAATNPTYSMNVRVGPNAYDCSGLIWVIFKNVMGTKWLEENGIPTNYAPTAARWYEIAAAKSKVAQNKATKDLKKGALRFFRGGARVADRTKQIGHIALVVGDPSNPDKVIDASSSKNTVLERNYISDTYIEAADFLDGVSGGYEGSTGGYNNYAEADFTGHILAGGLPITNIDTYQQTMLDNLSLIRSANYDAGYLIDLTTGGEFKFYIPEYSKGISVSYEDVSILGRSVNLKGYSGGSGATITLSLDFVAGSGFYTKKSQDDDPIDRMYSDIAFIESLSYPDYSKSMVFPPSIVLLSLGSEVTIKGVVTSFSADYKKPLDRYNRSMYVTVSFAVTQVSDNPPDMFDVRSRNEVSY